MGLAEVAAAVFIFFEVFLEPVIPPPHLVPAVAPQLVELRKQVLVPKHMNAVPRGMAGGVHCFLALRLAAGVRRGGRENQNPRRRRRGASMLTDEGFWRRAASPAFSLPFECFVVGVPEA